MLTPPNTAGFLAEVADLGLSEASPPNRRVPLGFGMLRLRLRNVRISGDLHVGIVEAEQLRRREFLKGNMRRALFRGMP